MAHHKRKGPKSSRAGCPLCKPPKRQGAPFNMRENFSTLRRRRVAAEKLAEARSRPDPLCAR